jgi:hypothetical protein
VYTEEDPLHIPVPESLLVYHILADFVVAFHVAYVGYVVLGQLAILLGVLMRWKWIRNPWFRWTHLVMMSIVGYEAAASITCPLTTWEADLRRLANEGAPEGSFVGRLLHDLIFIDAPNWAIESGHVAFALLVIAIFVLAPPRSFRKRPLAGHAAAVHS